MFLLKSRTPRIGGGIHIKFEKSCASRFFNRHSSGDMDLSLPLEISAAANC